MEAVAIESMVTEAAAEEKAEDKADNALPPVLDGKGESLANGGKGEDDEEAIVLSLLSSLPTRMPPFLFLMGRAKDEWVVVVVVVVFFALRGSLFQFRAQLFDHFLERLSFALASHFCRCSV